MMEPFTLLMPVYGGDDAAHFQKAFTSSVTAQTRRPDEVVLVQGGRVLDDLRRRMGTDAFWAAMRAYVTQYRGGIGGTRQLLETLRAGTDVNLLPVLRSRFPSLY